MAKKSNVVKLKERCDITTTGSQIATEFYMTSKKWHKNQKEVVDLATSELVEKFELDTSDKLCFCVRPLLPD